MSFSFRVTVEEPYFFPYVSAFEATVMESPPAYEAKLPNKIPTKVFKVYPFPQREIPIDVSAFYLTGYSLGGIQSAFVSMLDEDKKVFNFKRVLLINPPVNLFHSVSILDEMLVENVPGGLENFDKFIQEIMKKFAAVSEKLGYVEFSSDYLYRVYKKYPPREDFLATLIGFSFRISSSSLIFAADVMNGGGYVVPKNVGMSNSTSLTPYSMVLFRTGFTDYFHEYFYPYFREREPGLAEQELIDQLSLKNIDSYLRDTEKIGLMTNEDDIILAPGEIEYTQGRLRKTSQDLSNRGPLREHEPSGQRSRHG